MFFIIKWAYMNMFNDNRCNVVVHLVQLKSKCLACSLYYSSSTKYCFNFNLISILYYNIPCIQSKWIHVYWHIFTYCYNTGSQNYTRLTSSFSIHAISVQMENNTSKYLIYILFEKGKITLQHMYN